MTLWGLGELGWGDLWSAVCCPSRTEKQGAVENGEEESAQEGRTNTRRLKQLVAEVSASKELMKTFQQELRRRDEEIVALRSALSQQVAECMDVRKSKEDSVIQKGMPEINLSEAKVAPGVVDLNAAKNYDSDYSEAHSDVIQASPSMAWWLDGGEKRPVWRTSKTLVVAVDAPGEDEQNEPIWKEVIWKDASADQAADYDTSMPACSNDDWQPRKDTCSVAARSSIDIYTPSESFKPQVLQLISQKTRKGGGQSSKGMVVPKVHPGSSSSRLVLWENES